MENFLNSVNDSNSDIAEDIKIELPPQRKVIFYNDDFTTMDFVVEVLISVFNKSREEATNLMQTVHQEGNAIVGEYTADIAISRARLAKSIARQQGFPLRVEVE